MNSIKARILYIIFSVPAFLAACQVETAAPLPTPQVIVKECTTAGCGTSLTVTFSGQMPADFVMRAQSPDAQAQEVHCMNGEGHYPAGHFERDSYMLCQGNGVEIVNFSPTTVMISVESQGSSAVQTFTPQYKMVYPNGPDCEPQCPVASIEFELPHPLSFEPAVYRDEAAGFEMDYPAGWTAEGPQVVGERGYIAQFTSYPHQPGVYPDVPPEGSTYMQAAVLLWDPKGDLDAFANQRKQGWAASGNTILEEQQHLLAGDLSAVSFVVDSPGGQVYYLLAALGDKYLAVSGQGDTNLLDEIARTVRTLE